MLGISERQLRSWERQGLVPESWAFSFTDLIALKTVQKLRQNRIPSKKIGRALESLKTKLSDVERPLSELKITSEGRTISVQVAGEMMEAISGQMLFNFDTAAAANLKSFPERPANRVSGEKQAELWFQKGLHLEEIGSPIEEAIECYQKAVELNAAAAGALVNLGTIYYRMRKLTEAESYYRKAIEAEPDYALAHFNLGNLYDEEGDTEKALECYSLALQLNPDYADAHFNLALLCERRGDGMKAVRHWKAYLKLDASSSWATVARRQLDKLRQAALVHNRV